VLTTERSTDLHLSRAAGLLALTERERQVAASVAVGASNMEIAERLAITERTVKAHLTHMFHKLGLSSRLELALYTLSGESRGVPTSTCTKVQ
jgi:DNA-binding CsgD family transcriptional regulator